MRGPGVAARAADGSWRDARGDGHGERGSLAILVAFAMVALLGMSAVALDVGEAYRVQAHLENAAIEAAVSGARRLPFDPDGARDVAEAVARANGVAGPLTVDVRASREGGPLDQVVVEAQGRAEFWFARALGYDHVDVGGRAVAQAGTPRSMRGLVPMGVPEQDFAFGAEYTLKYVDPTAPGNFGLLSFDGRGGSQVREYLTEGYPGEVSVGEWVETEPGNKVGPTVQGLQARIDADPDATCETVQPGSPRLIFVPVVDFDGVNGRDEVPVLGFAAFFLESLDGGLVTGCFVHASAVGEWSELDDSADFGATVVALVQ